MVHRIKEFVSKSEMGEGEGKVIDGLVEMKS